MRSLLNTISAQQLHLAESTAKQNEVTQSLRTENCNIASQLLLRYSVANDEVLESTTPPLRRLTTVKAVLDETRIIYLQENAYHGTHSVEIVSRQLLLHPAGPLSIRGISLCHSGPKIKPMALDQHSYNDLPATVAGMLSEHTD